MGQALREPVRVSRFTFPWSPPDLGVGDRQWLREDLDRQPVFLHRFAARATLNAFVVAWASLSPGSASSSKSLCWRAALQDRDRLRCEGGCSPELGASPDPNAFPGFSHVKEKNATAVVASGGSHLDPFELYTCQ